MTERLPFHFSLSCIGEGNGNPLQCSCLENPREGGPWWAAVSGVTQSRTRLKRLSSSSSRLSQSTGLSSLSDRANSHWLSMYMFPCYSLCSFHSLLPLLCPQVSSPCLHLHCCPADEFISTIFLDSM